MKQTAIIVGMGEMGGVFARGYLKAGYSVTPVSRQDDIQSISQLIPDPVLVLIAVGESDLSSTVQQIPDTWLNKVVLLQNELLPRDWENTLLVNPSIISVWFEKKPGMDYKVLIPSPVFGPQSKIIHKALSTLNIPVQIIENESDMLFELVRKNMFILTTNICGLETTGTVSDLWKNHTALMNNVFDEVLEIQQYLTGQVFNRDQLLKVMLTAFEADPEHKCMGRSAPGRLQRALRISDNAKLKSQELKRLFSSLK